VRRGLYGFGASGAGCHPVPTIAMIRAITEAFQSRLTFIAGGRDDLFWSSYKTDLPQDAPNSATFLVELAESAPVLAAEEAAPADLPATASGVVDWLLSRLKGSGCGPVVRCDLSCPGSGLSVVKLVAPRLEIEQRRYSHTPGQRLLRWIAARTAA
jgi:ribosomal protein S12 methylthiotransferase accessory factor